MSAPSRATRFAAVLLVVALFATACGGDDDDSSSGTSGGGGAQVSTATPKPGGKLIMGVEAEVDGFDPTQNRMDVTGLTYASTVYDPLGAFGKDGKVHPYLAESIDHNADLHGVDRQAAAQRQVQQRRPAHRRRRRRRLERAPQVAAHQPGDRRLPQDDHQGRRPHRASSRWPARGCRSRSTSPASSASSSPARCWPTRRTRRATRSAPAPSSSRNGFPATT